MECFKHDGVPAVALCKSCYKAVCKSCAITLPKGVACSPECEKDVLETIEVVERSKKIYGIGEYKSTKLASAVWVWLLLSLCMWGACLFPLVRYDSFNYGILIMAGVFSVITLIVYRSSRNTGIKY